MDDLAHDFPLNHRKRKADQDDCNDQPNAKVTTVGDDPLINDTPTAGPSRLQSGPSHAPRQQWLASGAGNPIWSSPPSPQPSSPLSSQAVLHHRYPDKRPRLEKHSPVKRPSRKSSAKFNSPKLPAVHTGSDVEDIGIVSTADPGPSSGSLLRKHPSRVQIPLISIDLNSLHIPPMHPLVNRQTLKELDLDAILRNPQLRHDLLFDPGLQFRPTCSRRKRDTIEKYWIAIQQEVETGCTCVSFDLQGKPHPLVCVCSTTSQPPTTPTVYPCTNNIFTLRMPSRIRRLLTEFREVILLIIQPLSTISGIYVNPNTFKSQMQEHSEQAAFIRSIFDPALIEQEMKHDMFDPSGLFRAIGSTLKGHCAPMRDHAIEMMVQAAQPCAPGGAGTKADAVKAVRMCMEILELMKLDIANHQLQALRPFLIRTSGQFEIKTLKVRMGDEVSFRSTRAWLHAAHTNMLARVQPVSNLVYPLSNLNYDTLPQNQQVYIAAMKGIVDLVFAPPPVSPLTSPANSPPTSPISPPTTSSLTAFPETLHLDTTRLGLLCSEAADITASYMFLLLYRQLVHADATESASQAPPKVDDLDLVNLKREIHDLGSSRLGCYFVSNAPHENSFRASLDERERARRLSVKQDIVLQIAKRAQEAHSRAHKPQATSTTPTSPMDDAPAEHMLNVAQRWTDTNMQVDSPLTKMLHERLRDVVLNSVLFLGNHNRNPAPAKHTAGDASPLQAECRGDFPLGTATGMEPLAEEIHCLSEKIWRLSLIHLNTYLPLYENMGPL